MRVIRIAAALLLTALSTFAQTSRGGITGTVFDPSGAVVPNALVTVRSLGTNQTTKVKTSGSGEFSVTALDPVTYSVTVEASGFKKTVVEAIKVDTANIENVIIKLVAGQVNTEITVTAESAAVNTESGTTSSTVNERQIQDIPLFNRSVLDLAVTQPNVTGDAGTENPAITSNATGSNCEDLKLRATSFIPFSGRSLETFVSPRSNCLR